MRTKIVGLLSLLVVGSFVLAACAAPEQQLVTIVVGGEVQVVTTTPEPMAAAPKVLHYQRGIGAGDMPTLDPSKAEDTTSIQYLQNLDIGLTRLNSQTAALEPGLASSWDSVVNADGTETITFHLMEGIPWVRYDGTDVVQVMDCQETPQPRTVTAQDFAYGLLRTLDPKTASPYAYLPSFVVKGAAEYNNGETDDPSTVGVEVIDDHTLAITFLQEAAYNASIAGLWTGYAEPKWVVEGDDCTQPRGDRWFEPGFNESYGPYALKEWVHDSYASVIRNPFWPGTDNIPQAKIDEVVANFIDTIPAFADYEAGNVDTATVPLADIDRVKADPVLSKEYVVLPDPCTYYYGYNTQAPFVDDQRVRLALSEAIDRQSLIDNVTKGGQEPAQWFVRPGMTAAPTMAQYPDLGVKYDPTDAKAQLQSYLDEKGLTADQVDLTLMFNTSSGHQRIAEAIQQMWKDNLGLDVQLTNQEWAVYLNTTKDPVATPQIFRLGWCMDYPDANNWDREVFAAGGSYNPNAPDPGGIGWFNQHYEDLVKAAASETDPAKRTDMYAQAEELLVKTDAAIAPIYWYTQTSVFKPYLKYTPTVVQHDYWYLWDIEAH
jgi:oligopeptide transport system substrate-binding protein